MVSDTKDSETRPSEITPESLEHAFSPYHVLMVEDEREQAELVMEYLQVSGPFKIDWSKNIQGLWEHLAEEKYDIILLDYRLPDGTGLDALGELPRRGYETPVLMITGQGDERLAVQAMQLGAVDYVVKGSDYLPTLPTLIQRAIRAHQLQLSVQRSLEQIRYQALLLNNVRDAVVVWGIDGKITYWNPAAEALFGWKKSERVGGSIEENYINAFTPEVKVPPPGGTSGQQVERQYINKDGKEVWISSRLATLRDYGADQQIIGYLDISRDITKRKQAEEELRYRVDVEELIGSISTDFINLETDQIDRGINRALKDIGSHAGVDGSFVVLLSEDGVQLKTTHKWCASEVKMGSAGFQGLPVSAIPWTMKKLERLESIQISRIEAMPPEARAERVIMKSLDILSVAAVPLVYSGSPTGLLGFASTNTERAWAKRDISLLRSVVEIIVNALEHKRMDAQIRAAHTKLAQTARLAAIGELASGVAHHINNPLTTIIAEAQILLQSLTKEHLGRESAEAIEQAGWRVQKTVQQLLDFSRPASNTLEQLSINETIESALTLVSDHINSSGITLKVELSKELPEVRGNHRQLGDLWVNLLMLARGATADGHSHSIWIRSSCTPDGAAVVEIRDDGEVIPAEEMATLFEPNFIRSIGGRGTGIELNICQEIVRQHHGQITAESDNERGTIFRVIFPMEA